MADDMTMIPARPKPIKISDPITPKPGKISDLPSLDGEDPFSAVDEGRASPGPNFNAARDAYYNNQINDELNSPGSQAKDAGVTITSVDLEDLLTAPLTPISGKKPMQIG